MHLKQQLPKVSLAWVWYGTSFSGLMQDSLVSQDSGVLEAVSKPFFKKLKPHLLLNQWVSFNIDWNSKLVSCKALTIKPENEQSAILIFGEELPDISESQYQLAELCLTNMSFLRHHQDVDLKLKELERHMRYQIVWSETLEWIRTLNDENSDVYKKLMIRLSLLTESTASAVRVEGEQALWVYRGIDEYVINQIEAIFKGQNKDLYATSMMEHFNYLSDLYSSFDMVELHPHVLVCPVLDPEGQRKALIILTKQNAHDGYLITDHIYINQLISQVYEGIEKNRLVCALAASNQSLEKEHEAQNALIQKLKDTQAQLLQSEKMASIGQLAAGVAHEINNPIGFLNSNFSTLSEFSESMLTVIQKLGESILSGPEKEHNNDYIAQLQQLYQQLVEKYEIEFITDDLPTLLDESKDGISRVKDIVQGLKDFSHMGSGEFSIVNIQHIIDKTLNLIHNEVKYIAELVIEYGDIPDVEIMESQIGQVILNLLVNASHAMKEKGTISITTKMGPRNNTIQILVADTGQGIPPENLGKLFDPFFTTKPIGKGTGLGLSLSYGILQRHHGDIQVKSELGVGTTFILTLPVTQPVKLKTTNNST